MADDSLFSCLPSIVIVRIVRYVCKLSYVEKCILGDNGKTATSVQKRNILLAHICTAWRQVVLEILCNTCDLQLSCGYQRVYSSRYGIHSEIMSENIEDWYFRFVRELIIMVDDKEVFNGKATQYLQKLSGKHIPFPLVAIGCIALNNTPYADDWDNCSTQNVKEFADLVNQFAPNIVKMENYLPIASKNGPSNYWDLLHVLTNRLFREKQACFQSLNHGYNLPSTLATIPTNITSLKIINFKGDTDIFKLMHLNSQSIQEIAGVLQNPSDLSKIILDSTNMPVKYPYLINLTVSTSSESITESKKSFAESIVPFPRLKRLSLACKYPFADGVIFRDNSSSLEVLRCGFDYETIAMLNMENRHKNRKISKLKKVVLYSVINDIDNGDQEASEYLKFLCSSGSSARVLTIVDSDIAESLLNHLAEPNNNFKNIGYLTLQNAHLAFPQLMDVLKALPYLQCLSSGLAEHEVISKAMDMPRLLDFLYSKYHYAFPHFKLWKISSNTVVSVKPSVAYAMLISIMCPRFTAIQLPQPYIQAYAQEVKDSIQQQPYAKYSVYVSKLLPLTHQNI